MANGTGGELIKVGSGTLTLLGTNTYSGGTRFDGGVVAVERDANLGTGPLSFNGGTLEALASGGGIISAKTVKLNIFGGTFLADAGTTSVLNGVISGSGSFTKDGAGELILTANNTYASGTTIREGTLQLGNGIGTNGSIVGNVVDNGTLVFFHGSGQTTFPGVISGSGSLIKAGDDTLLLTANNSYEDTIIKSGTLVTGTPNASQAISFALGRGDVFLQGGTLRTPSLDPVVINVGRDYTESANGTLALGVAGLDGSQYDHVQVGRDASLNGTLSVTSLNNFRPSNGNAFEVLRSNGTTSGQFSNIVDNLNNNPGLQRVDVYAKNGVALVYIAPVPPPPPPPPGVTPTPPPPITVEDPNPLRPVEPDAPLPLPEVVTIIDPTVEQLTSLYEVSFSGANMQRFNLGDRMFQIQQGMTGFVSPITPVPPPPPTGKEITEGKGAEGKAPPPVPQPGPTNRWGVWANGWGDFVHLDSTSAARGYNFTTGGMSAGVDYLITDHFAVGLFGGYSHTWVNFNPSGSATVNTGRGGLYATYFQQGWWINAAVWGGGNSYSTSRQAVAGQANGETDGYEISTFGDAGYDFHCGDLSFGPTVSMQYTNVHLSGFGEHGSLVPLDIHGDSQDSLRTDVGGQAYYKWHVGSIPVIPNVRLAWEHEYFYSNLPITATAPLLNGATATFNGPNEGHDSLIINANLAIQCTPRIWATIGYDGQVARDHYNSNAVTGTFSFSF
jgi:fibronectin-binding autotransporter adhesin